MTKYIKKSKEEKKKEINETLKKLEEGVKNVFTSENYLNYLKFALYFL